MSKIIRVIIQDSLHQNKNREEVNNREIRYLPDYQRGGLVVALLAAALGDPGSNPGLR